MIARLIGGALAVLVLAQVTPAAAGQGKVPPPPEAYFGMHYARIADGSWPQAPVGSVRLWDTWTGWPQIQPRPSVWDWTNLDAAVDNAEARGVEVSYVFGARPAWANHRFALWRWRAYVRAVVTRYAGRIDTYEAWNEPDCGTCWTIEHARWIATLARVVYREVQRHDPDAIVVSPSFVVRAGHTWLRLYGQAGGYRWADVIGVHGYPGQGQSVEQGMAMMDATRAAIARFPAARGKPVWDTETNLETNTARSGSLSPREQAGGLARYYLLSWSRGIDRVGWYDWTATPNLGVRVARYTGSTRPSVAGRAFARVQRWMDGSSEPCRVGPRGVYRCRYDYGQREAVVMWHPGGTVRAVAPAGAVRARDVLGQDVRVGERVRVGEVPVRVIRRR